MKRILIIIFCIALSSCSFFKVHKLDVDQGNIITPQALSQLRIGMSESQVKEIMGPPLLVNVFTSNRMDYVYTFQKGHEPMTEVRVTCIFQNGRLKEIIR